MLYMYDIKAGFHNDIGMQSEGSVQETRVRFNHATATYSVHFDRHLFARPDEGEETVFIYGDQGFCKSERVMVPFTELFRTATASRRQPWNHRGTLSTILDHFFLKKIDRDVWGKKKNFYPRVF